MSSLFLDSGVSSSLEREDSAEGSSKGWVGVTGLTLGWGFGSGVLYCG